MGVIINEVLQSSDANYGYDFVANEYGNMLEFGIVDPVKVTRSAIENSASVASMILTTDKFSV